MKNLPAVKEGDAAVPDPLLLALKTEEEGHEPKNGSGFWNLGMTVILQSAREQGPRPCNTKELDSAKPKRAR